MRSAGRGSLVGDIVKPGVTAADEEGAMVEVLGAATAIGMAAATARFSLFLGDIWIRIRDELRFSRFDRRDLDRRFARIIGERAPFDER